jgi:hypothetical protein
MKFGCFMHNQGDKLYGITMTGQVLWVELMLLNGFNPSDVRPSLHCVDPMQIMGVSHRMTSILHCPPDASTLRLLCAYQCAILYG